MISIFNLFQDVYLILYLISFTLDVLVCFATTCWIFKKYLVWKRKHPLPGMVMLLEHFRYLRHDSHTCDAASSPDIRTIHGSISWEKRSQGIPSFAPRCRTAPSDALNRTQRAEWCWLFKATMSASPRIHKMKQHKSYTYATIYIKLESIIYKLHLRFFWNLFIKITQKII